MEIVQAVKKLNSISRARLNFRRRPILCTTLYRNLMQACNFGGTFDQLFLWIFYEIFTEGASPLLLYHGAKKSKMTKNSDQRGGGSLTPPKIIECCRANFAFLPALKIGTFRGKWTLESLFKTSHFVRLALHFLNPWSNCFFFASFSTMPSRKC